MTTEGHSCDNCVCGWCGDPEREDKRRTPIITFEDYSPECCIGDCCGPGSYCCNHPANKHTHDDD